ncbi:type II toxin-antitoxin system VapB family antitoxin [Ferrovibrio sp.]|uniref:type II toxin-antitoxin system VapB family antitoxin n=1 Tax=Ferrovibrio sp. TaxID=1917215 RepID=UPI0025BCB185|nr:type II toxin-antitoxin system VapB family antitoxin [Ferrovibrio sp.]MBX3455970.1 type II toxin-antitoxin system VapB family antitoxin [Ferrovibrio sp.]
MGMNIKSEEAHQLAKAITDHTGETITSAVVVALRERLARLQRERDVAEKIRRIDEVLARSGPTPPGVTSDHSDLYDEFGLPK